MSHVTEDTDVLITQLRKSKSSESGESETAKDNQSDCKVRSRDERGDESTPPRTHVSRDTVAQTTSAALKQQAKQCHPSGEWRVESREVRDGDRTEVGVS